MDQHTSPGSTGAVMHRLGREYPELGGLIGMLTGRQNVIDVDFVKAYEASPLPGIRKSLVIRAATGDESIGVAGPLEINHVASIVGWLSAHGALAHGEAPEHILPKGFVQRVIGRRRNFSDATGAVFIKPWWANQCGRTLDVSAYEDMERGALAALLERVALARHLGPEAAIQLLQTGKRLSGRSVAWYFETGVAQLDLRNAMVFLAELIDGDRRGGRAQSDIPVAFSTRWRLPRLCLPAAIGFCDVVAGMLAGVIDTNKLEHDPCGLVPVLSDATSRAFVSGTLGVGDPAASGAQRAHLRRWMQSKNWVESWMASRGEVRRGVFDTGFMLNADRIPELKNGLAFLAPYYAAFDGHQWIRLLAMSDDPTARDIAPRLRGLMHAKLLERNGVRARDLGNVLMFLDHARVTGESDAYAALPSVGRLTLGGTMSPSGNSRSTRAISGRKQRRDSRVFRGGELSLYRAVTSTPPRDVDVVYLLQPGYRGEIPTDHPVVTHRVWRTLDVPCPVDFVGPDSLPWFTDPWLDARARLAAQGIEVIELRAGQFA